MKILKPIGFAGRVYRPGHELELQAAIEKAEKAGKAVPDPKALEASGVIRTGTKAKDAEPAPTGASAEAPSAPEPKAKAPKKSPKKRK